MSCWEFDDVHCVSELFPTIAAANFDSYGVARSEALPKSASQMAIALGDWCCQPAESRSAHENERGRAQGPR